jgi:hypothetical protein
MLQHAIQNPHKMMILEANSTSMTKLAVKIMWVFKTNCTMLVEWDVGHDPCLDGTFLLGGPTLGNKENHHLQVFPQPLGNHP